MPLFRWRSWKLPQTITKTWSKTPPQVYTENGKKQKHNSSEGKREPGTRHIIYIDLTLFQKKKSQQETTSAEQPTSSYILNLIDLGLWRKIMQKKMTTMELDANTCKKNYDCSYVYPWVTRLYGPMTRESYLGCRMFLCAISTNPSIWEAQGCIFRLFIFDM